MAVAGKQEKEEVGAGVVGAAGAGVVEAAQAVARTPLARMIDGLVYIGYAGKKPLNGATGASCKEKFSPRFPLV